MVMSVLECHEFHPDFLQFILKYNFFLFFKVGYVTRAHHVPMFVHKLGLIKPRQTALSQTMGFLNENITWAF